jgi:hypothetical protein
MHHATSCSAHDAHDLSLPPSSGHALTTRSLPQVEKYGHMFEDITYVETFKQLRLKYDQAPERQGQQQQQQPPGSESPGGGGSRAQVDAYGPGACVCASMGGGTYLCGGGRGLKKVGR